MFELVRLIIDTAGQLLPFRVCWAWQKGLYYFCGRYQFTCGPGLKLVFPGLCDVKTVSVVPEIYTTPLQTITLRDGRSLTYSASLTVIVVDANLAYNTLGHFQETVVELAARLVSVGLADADVERFDPARGKRDRLVEELRGELDRAVKVYGLSVTALGLNNFALGVRTIRLLLDHAVLGQKDHLA